MPAQQSQIVVHLPPRVSTADQADLANAIWAIAPEGSSVEVRGVDADTVNAEMDARWKDVPEWDAKAHTWRKPRRRSGQ